MKDETQVALITGASSGIGRELAIALARAGWRIIGTGRDGKRMAAAREVILAESSSGKVEMLAADLSLLGEAARLAEEVAARTGRLDLLVNNAGGMTDTFQLTGEGLEANFAGNHFGPFLLTQRLLPLLRSTASGRAAGAVRVLFTSSDASEMLPGVNLEDLERPQNFNPGFAYCAGKLANVLTARELAERLADTGIVAHSVHPGPVQTNFYAYVPDDTRERTRELEKFTPQEGADTLFWLATSAEGAQNSGAYWYQRAQRQPHALVDDAAFRQRFWAMSERVTGS